MVSIHVREMVDEPTGMVMVLQRQIAALESELETARRTIDQLVIECEAWECEAGYGSEDVDDENDDEKEKTRRKSVSRRQSIMSAMKKKKRITTIEPAEVVSAPATPADASVKWRDNESVLKMAMMIEGADDVKTTPVSNRVRPFLLEMTHGKEEEEDDKDGSVGTIDSDILAESRIIIDSLLGADHVSKEKKQEEDVDAIDPEILAESRVVIESLLGIDQTHDNILKKSIDISASPPSSLPSPSNSAIALLDTDDEYFVCASAESFASQNLHQKDEKDGTKVSSIRDDQSPLSFGFCAAAATATAGFAVLVAVSPLFSSSSSAFLHPS